MSDAFRQRCREFLVASGVWDSVLDSYVLDDLMAFVTTEIGRAADERFDDAVPLALFFDNVQDRREFIDAVQQAKPSMIKKTWPK